MPGKRKMLGGRIHVGYIISVMVIIIIAGVLLLPYLARTGTAMMLEKSAETLADELQLPPSEKTAVMDKVYALADKIRNKEIDRKQLEKLSQDLAAGPLPTMVMARVVEIRYLRPSGLPEDEKQAGALTLWRFAQGVIAKDIPAKEADAIEEVLFEIPKDSPAAGKKETSYRDKKLKEKLAPEELTGLLAKMKAAADKAGVAKFVERPDIAGEIQKAIDRLMAEPKTPAS